MSCTHAWESTKAHSHCGGCSQCIDRRFAILASNYAAHDPAENYKIDLLTGPRKPGEERTMLESYVKTAVQITKMSDTESFSRFPEASRVLRHFEGTADETATKIWDLHLRHAEQIGKVLQAGYQAHSADILGEKLPESCLLIIAFPERYRTVAKPAEVEAEAAAANGKQASQTEEGPTATTRETPSPEDHPAVSSISTSNGMERGAPKKEAKRGNARKGDSALLYGKDAVSFRTAEQYLGISERQRQHLISSGALKVVGAGHNRKITTESLKKYLPPENPN